MAEKQIQPLRTKEFCCGKKNCPVLSEMQDGTFHIGSPEEGTTIWNKGQLTDFINAAKRGEFDDMIK